MGWQSSYWNPNVVLGLGLTLLALQQYFLTLDPRTMEACNKLLRVPPSSLTSLLKSYFFYVLTCFCNLGGSSVSLANLEAC